MKKYIVPGWEPVTPGWNWRRLIRPVALAAIICIAAVFVSKLHKSGPQSQVNGAKLVDLKALGDFTLDPTTGTLSDVPAKFRELDGQRISTEGFMWAPDSDGVKDFQLVYNITSSTGWNPPLVQQRIFCHVAGAKPVPYYYKFVQVTGVLHVGIDRENGKIVSVYSMDVDSVAAPPDSSK